MTIPQSKSILEYIDKNYKCVEDVRIGTAEINFSSVDRYITITYGMVDNDNKIHIKVLERYSTEISLGVEG